MPTPPITVTLVSPSRAAPSTFSALMDILLSLLPTWTTQANTLAAGVDADAVQTAADRAQCDLDVVACNAIVTSVTATSNVTKWISGTSYLLGQTVYSVTNLQTYRRKVAGAGTTDPSADNANWTLISGSNLKTVLAMTTISAVTYNTDGSFNVVTYSTGNKVVFGYTAGALTSAQYYDTNGSSLLFTETLSYSSGNISAVTWS